MTTKPAVPQERFSPELVEQIIKWQDRVTADQSVIFTQECRDWVAANAMVVTEPKFWAHHKELYLLVQRNPKKGTK